MSVPWEVWCSTSSGDGKELDGLCRELKAEKVCVGDIRYLRADLTCGECDSIDRDNRGTYCIKRALPVGRNEPACMAFVPKEQR